WQFCAGSRSPAYARCQVTEKLPLLSDLETCAFTVVPIFMMMSLGFEFSRFDAFAIAPVKSIVPKFARGNVLKGPWPAEGASAMTSADERAALLTGRVMVNSSESVTSSILNV